MYQIELVWNREFDWVPYGSPMDDIENAKLAAFALLEMGDGASVKKVRIRDLNSGEIVR